MKRRAESTVAPLSRLPESVKGANNGRPFRQQARVAPKMTPVPLRAAFPSPNPFGTFPCSLPAPCVALKIIRKHNKRKDADSCLIFLRSCLLSGVNKLISCSWFRASKTPGKANQVSTATSCPINDQGSKMIDYRSIDIFVRCFHE